MSTTTCSIRSVVSQFNFLPGFDPVPNTNLNPVRIITTFWADPKGVHPSFKEFHHTYPMKSRKLLRISQRYVLVNATTQCSATLLSWHANPDADRLGRFARPLLYHNVQEPVGAGALGPDSGRNLVPPAPRISVS